MASGAVDERPDKSRDDRHQRKRSRRDDDMARDGRSRQQGFENNPSHEGAGQRHRHRSHRQTERSPDRSRSPSHTSHRHRHRQRSNSPSRRHDDGRRTRHNHNRSKQSSSRSPVRSRDRLDARQSRKPLPSQEESYRGETDGQVAEVKSKERPNFKTSGLLAADSNMVTVGSGVNAKKIALKYHEPPEARKPPSSQPWTMFVFEEGDKDPLETIDLHKRTCWLVGSDETVTDLPVDDPSCSKQHAVFQFRFTSKTDEYGDRKSKVALYLLDLESRAGTFVNGKRIDVARYVQCLSGDVVKFGKSSQEFVIMLPPKG